MKKYSQSWRSLQYKGRRLNNDWFTETITFVALICTFLIFQALIFTLVP